MTSEQTRGKKLQICAFASIKFTKFLILLLITVNICLAHARRLKVINANENEQSLQFYNVNI